MFETGIRQLRMVTSVVRCRPLNVHNLELLIDDALETLAAFGSPGDDVDQLLGGPFADPESRQVFQARALGRTARRLARSSPYYRRLFAVSGFDPTRFTLDDMASVPVTTKHDLMACGEDFVVEGSKPFVATRTTGTTGQPVMIWLSRYEVELWPAISALGGLLRGEISPDDCMQINVSSRATAAVLDSLAVCRLVGARARAVGGVPADDSIDSLGEGGARAPRLLTT
jgi:phenylacetate-CoA ligase